MAPELHGGSKKFKGKPADIWAAGIVLYEMVMLELPFDGSTEQIMKRAKKLDCKPFPDYVDERLQNLWDLMVKVGPDERFNATELLRLDFMKEVLEKLCDDKIRVNCGFHIVQKFFLGLLVIEIYWSELEIS